MWLIGVILVLLLLIVLAVLLRKPRPATQARYARADYTGKSWLQRNSYHVALLGFEIFIFWVYGILPVLEKQIPNVPAVVFSIFGGLLLTHKVFSGRADVALNRGKAEGTMPDTPAPATPPATP